MTSSSRRGAAGRRKPGELESAVLGVLWSTGRPMSPGEVNDALGSGLAYATVSTTLVRLAEKSQLRRTTVGRTHRYEPAVARDFGAEGVPDRIAALGRAPARGRWIAFAAYAGVFLFVSGAVVRALERSEDLLEALQNLR